MGECFPDTTIRSYLQIYYQLHCLSIPLWQLGCDVHLPVVHSFNNHMALAPNGYTFKEVYIFKFIVTPEGNRVYPTDILFTGS